MEKIPCCSMMIFDAAEPQQPRRGPCGRSGLHLRKGSCYFRDAGSRKTLISASHRGSGFCHRDLGTSREFPSSLGTFSTLPGDYRDKQPGIGKHEQSGEFSFFKESQNHTLPLTQTPEDS